MHYGEEDLSQEEKSFFGIAAKLIGGQYDEKTGINKNVYPAGLPDGSENGGEKINYVFSKLGECDGYLISGKSNFERMSKFVKRSIKVIAESDKSYEPSQEKIAA